MKSNFAQTLAALLVAALLLGTGYHFGIARPAEKRAEAARMKAASAEHEAVMRWLAQGAHGPRPVPRR